MTAPQKGSGSNQKIASSLVALSSAAVLTIYAAGYLRTRSAAELFEVEGAQRRIAGPAEARPLALPAPPASAVDVPSPSTVSATPAASSSPVSPRPSSAASPASTPAPELESAEAVTASPSVAPSAVPSADPVTTDGVRTTDSPPAPAVAPQPHYKDGTYSGWGTSRHGDIQATVVVAEGRIASAEITQCLTRYSCSWVSMLPGQVVSRQSADVDYVSGATQSTNAFYYAILEALSKAK